MHNLHAMTPQARSSFEALKQRLESPLRKYCPTRDGDLFLLRLERYFNDFYGPLVQLYGQRADFTQQLTALADLMLDGYLARSDALRLLDIERQLSPDWFQHQAMLGYVCYASRFAGSLREVGERLDYLQELGVTYLHLMPVLEPRPGPNDGGYAVKDYRTINPALGSMQDLSRLAKELHARGISLCIDLVLNHTAREHAWAQRAMQGEQTYLDYYLTFPDRTLPDQYERTLREVFPDFAPGNFTWYPEMAETGRWVWTTFNEYQWDLNYRNPAVFREMVDTMVFLANYGADVLRLDAIPFIWKNMGTDCENQPEAHLLVQAFRGVMRVVAPGVIFKAEAIVPPEKLVPYLGVGTAAGKECELAYNNQLMVLLWSTLASRNVRLMTCALHQLPPTPAGTTWLTYLRNHDDIGWAITDENAAAVGENAFLHRQFLNDFYSGSFPGSFANGALFQYNPVTRDARISGTTAALAGLERAMQTPSADHQQQEAVARIVLLHSVILAFGGIPLLYMGDELGLPNDYRFADDEAKAADNRWLHRPAMDWQRAQQRHDAQSIAGRIYQRLRQLIAIRAATPALHGAALTQPMWTDNEHVFALARQHPGGNLLLLANFHEAAQDVSADLLWHAGLRGSVCNLLAAEAGPPPMSGGRLHLAAYESMWLSAP